MDPKTAANALREMRQPICLSMYRKQVKADHDGLPASYSAEAVQQLYEIIDTSTLNGARCHVIYNRTAPSAAVINMDATQMDGGTCYRTLAALELGRVSDIHTLLHIKSF